MSVSTKPEPRATVFNLPNQLTVSRLLLSMVLFGLITWKLYAASFIVFVVAASTDWLDGYFARKYGLVTRLGRILDPFVDKIIICGTFICLVADPASGIRGWMAVIVVGRELLITALRSFLEQQGADFSASMSGKLKMVLQCLAAGTSLFSLAGWASTAAGPPAWLDYLLTISVWGAVLLTIYSGIEYVRRAVALWRE
ncbi:MAG TPA: CDP-diacylglycerol--glycerol-3-phosphate 3-phosphatidyltransferase [Pirellulales bacterium]|nr:CDP-diacylglycerol--glycerol-3-phosphate 3-phosphatidyltransferase [Pirellulales bacterium]